MNRVCARWVPRLFTTGNMMDTLTSFKEGLKKNLAQLTDESWCHYYDPEIEQQ